ncbi:hypothetical protein [Maribellus sediminis]|uniref:hypothetical protein n=1 Tax=Maribellus sediminis TaxID=2696285 RepID=UPI0014315FCD|nr:hypothetical protein [Maribellus sediminis]
MSIERDYLMRQMMQLFQVLRKILGLREDGEIEEARSQVRYFYRILNINTDIQKLSIEELLHLLQEEKKFSNEQIELFAFVLKEQGEMADEETLRLDYFRKAWFLLDKVDKESISFSIERQMKLQELNAYLN